MAEKNVRQAEISRKTNETDIKMKLVIDGTGEADIDTGIGFLTICLTVLPDMVFLTLR